VPVFDFIGAHVVAEVKDRIQNTKLDPAGNEWAPWRPMTETLRTLAGNVEQGLLWDTGDLLDSIHEEVDGSFTLAIGSDSEYADAVQNGIEGKQVAREFLGWTDEDIVFVRETTLMYLEMGVLL